MAVSRPRTSPSASLTLFVPGLFSPPPSLDADDLAPLVTPALDTWLARADPETRAGASGMEAALFALFGVDPPRDADLPVAAVTRVVDMGVIDNEWWMRADPVHLRPERDRLILLDTQLVPLAVEEAQALVAELMQTYGDEGWVLKAPHPARWYLKPPREHRLVTTPVTEIVGRDIHPHLPRGEEGATWRGLLNEMQILLHTTRANEVREARGELAINSVWFWGSGRLPAVRGSGWARVCGDEPVALGLARLAGVPATSVPPRFSDLTSDVGRQLVVLEAAHAAAQYREARNWREAVQRLERDWIGPAYEAVRAGKLAEAVLCAENQRVFRLGRRAARRWWRRRRPLEAYA
ncbi:signal peptide protein [Sulfurifustis variabilis]|uniref:Signal peptide protein n=1 Tax=Sulfurifustis variabilis TaxID=1675686 RepID=A0A1B4VDL6_9GAMM|nr:signal peptide protein [Sulfurifustis variabilis]